MRPSGKATRSANIGNIRATSNAARRDARARRMQAEFHHGLLGYGSGVLAAEPLDYPADEGAADGSQHQDRHIRLRDDGVGQAEQDSNH
jgi:hypothetical protein